MDLFIALVKAAFWVGPTTNLGTSIVLFARFALGIILLVLLAILACVAFAIKEIML